MDYLLQNLHDQQIHLQTDYFSIHDIATMQNIDGKRPLPPPPKYVSIFRINGEPILPPLMTVEKRWEMQKLREKAILYEQRFIKYKQQELGKTGQCNKNIEKETCFAKSAGSICQILQGNNDYGLKKSGESIEFLSKILTRQQEEDMPEETMKNVFKASMFFKGNKTEDKLQKLEKSDTLIYDNSTNVVIKIPKQNVKISADISPEQANSDNAPNKPPSHLLLVGTNVKGITAIPSICLNPPTPLTADKSLYDTLSAAESSESAITSENPNQSMDFSHDELSSDENCSSITTHLDKNHNRYNRRSSIKTDSTDESLNNQKIKPKNNAPEKNVGAKIKQFEAISSDTNPPQLTPEKVYQNRKVCLGTPSGTMNRSATSPSIKIDINNRSSSYKSQSLVQGSDISPESNLVRSSSFTLEAPSKALIQHMQQQKVINDTKTGSNRNLSRKLISVPIRAHRDTVESKAKKVQKIEFKSTKPKTQLKITPSKLTQGSAASTSPYNAKSSTQYTNSVCKAKQSPSLTSPQKLQRSICTQMRKPNSTSSCLTQNKVSKSKLTSLSSTTTRRTTPPVNKLFKQAEINEKVHLLQLLAQQEAEHRNLQKAFELQQKFLIEQLSCELAASRVKSSNNSQNSSSKPSMSHHKQFGEETLPPTQFNCDHTLPKRPASSYDLTRHKIETTQYPSSHSISNNSSYIALDNNPRYNENSHKNPWYGPNCTQTIEPNPINSSYFSVMDQSNANNCLDISTLSMHTSPNTPLIQNNTFKNKTFNKATPSFCRRLFTTEINGADIGESARCIVSTAFEKVQEATEPKNQPQQVNYESNIRTPEYNAVALHTAATKINAFARGFLVRRLFKTEQIQRVVQTIRDTLIFVLNLHIETVENPAESVTPANVKLKSRLLQQLSSACRTLHLVFFQTSMKERMEIIARDRKRIKNKRMTMNHKR